MLEAPDVVIFYDTLIAQPHPKMVACVEPSEGWFYRINSRPFLRPCVPLVRDPDHLFLEHDSYLQCQVLFSDDYLIEKCLRHRGMIGRISPALKKEIIRWTFQARNISAEESGKIAAALR